MWRKCNPESDGNTSLFFTAWKWQSNALLQTVYVDVSLTLKIY